ncbi:MAG: hypothetical protein NC228_05500 [[Eubacterium] siraeum]|nr:hypothetical protein [[Eubacterium] siraeum]
MEPKAAGISSQSRKYPKVQNLMHNINEQTLMTAHKKQRSRKAVGADGISKAEYDENAAENIKNSG